LRINKYLALHLSTSRRKADELILLNKVEINGKVAKLGDEVITNDKVSYDSKIIKSSITFKYYKFYKPKGYICSHKSQGNSKIIYEIISDKALKFNGRLDKHSEGLMLLSNDGDWLNTTIHPSKGLIKKYIVSVSNPINLQKFNKAVVDREEYLRILDIRQLKRLTYEVSLKTGKNREIRRIFDSNKIKITTLKRISIGNYKLGNLKIGELREINSR
tara:strand:- start:643 stop:1293 length:651 start_codon:yes stop_codon:yes gene_type:complete